MQYKCTCNTISETQLACTYMCTYVHLYVHMSADLLPISRFVSLIADVTVKLVLLNLSCVSSEQVHVLAKPVSSEVTGTGGDCGLVYYAR